MALVSGPTVGNALADGNNSLAKLVKEIPDDKRLADEVLLRILNRPASDGRRDRGAGLRLKKR